MRIPKTVSAFKKWARKPRLKTTQIQSVGAFTANNMALDGNFRGVEGVIAVVAEECAMRWGKTTS